MSIETLSGDNVETFILNGKPYELKPVTPRMVSELTKWVKSRAITEFFQTAKDAGMPFDVISQQINRIQNTENLDELIGVDGAAYLIWLRSKHTGATLDEIMDIPIDEIQSAVGMNDEKNA